jgi:thiosulfate/3-mercaptopyruvate sulfurtransferase
VADPTLDPAPVCGTCHAEIVETAETSLHFAINGYYTVLGDRGVDFDDPAMAEAFGNHCTECHTTCGQCHVSRPTYSGGGLVKGHEFKKVTSISLTCTACHGSRVGPEYQGKNEGVKGDVHWFKGGMPCLDCHDVTQYHGDGTEYAHRYDGPAIPDCLDCHEDADGGADGVMQHMVHGDTVACQVCHSAGPYKNCYGCHVGKDDEGLPFRQTEPSQLQFKIGLNPEQSETRPWKWVLLRHVPVARTTFEYYGEDLMPEFDAVPTWKYTTPHNIQKVTPQNQDCNSCHGVAELYLTEADLLPDEVAANSSVVVTEIPAAR